MASSLTPQEQLQKDLLWGYGQSLNNPENRKKGQFDETIAEGKMGKFTFKNQAGGELLDLVSIIAWNSWGIDVEDCKVCGGGPFSKTYEVTFKWRDTEKYEYISEVCSSCLNIINQKIARNGNPKRTY